MYQDDWLIHEPTKEGVSTSVSVVPSVLTDMRFKVNLDKSAHSHMGTLLIWDQVGHSQRLPVAGPRQLLLDTLLHQEGVLLSHVLLLLVGAPLGLPQFCGPSLPLGRLKH